MGTKPIGEANYIKLVSHREHRIAWKGILLFNYLKV